ncbi:MAG: C40 family peptidase [Bacteroidales bacterium]|nr:C40 family peptidase [Bacteroidales bacterium]
MNYGYCHLSIIPLREKPLDTSQMTSQLLFGDVFEILETISDNWIHIRNAWDDYEGYMDPKQQISINEAEYNLLRKDIKTNKTLIEVISSQGKMLLPPACSFPSKHFNINDFSIEINSELQALNKTISLSEISLLANSFLNAPYLWGGKTPFGIDCSGFTQSIYKICGIKLKRDASQQAKQGKTLSFIEECQAGDLAFFDNEEGDIIHVGIILDEQKIIHASGKVRIDKLDHHGIYNEDLKKYTHQLRLLKKLTF